MHHQTGATSSERGVRGRGSIGRGEDSRQGMRTLTCANSSSAGSTKHCRPTLSTWSTPTGGKPAIVIVWPPYLRTALRGRSDAAPAWMHSSMSWLLLLLLVWAFMLQGSLVGPEGPASWLHRCQCMEHPQPHTGPWCQQPSRDIIRHSSQSDHRGVHLLPGAL